MSNKVLKSLLTLIMAAAMMFGIATLDGNVSVAAPTLSEINALKEEAEEIAEEKAESIIPGFRF